MAEPFVFVSRVRLLDVAPESWLDQLVVAAIALLPELGADELLELAADLAVHLSEEELYQTIQATHAWWNIH